MSAEFDEFTLPLGGKAYAFRFGLREVIEMQEALTIGPIVPTIIEINAGIWAGRLRYQRAMIWAGLRHSQPRLTEDATTSLMASASPDELKAVFSAFGYSVSPDPKDIAALEITPNPPTAQSETTGGSSTSEPVASV